MVRFEPGRMPLKEQLARSQAESIQRDLEWLKQEHPEAAAFGPYDMKRRADSVEKEQWVTLKKWGLPVR